MKTCSSFTCFHQSSSMPGKYVNHFFYILIYFIFFLFCIIISKFHVSFQVKKKRFFRNFNHILLFGVLGTVISFCLISLGNIIVLQPFRVSNCFNIILNLMTKADYKLFLSRCQLLNLYE